MPDMPIELFQRLEQVSVDLDYAHKNPDAKLTPTQEFRAELGRQMLCHGVEHGFSPDTDQDIAYRMALAGYGKSDITQAVQEGSLLTEKMEQCEPDIKGRYGEAITVSVLADYKVQEQIHVFAHWKAEQNLTHEYRLDKLGDLATDVKAEHCQQPSMELER